MGRLFAVGSYEGLWQPWAPSKLGGDTGHARWAVHPGTSLIDFLRQIGTGPDQPVDDDAEPW